jgi:hypothetical protein
LQVPPSSIKLERHSNYLTVLLDSRPWREQWLLPIWFSPCPVGVSCLVLLLLQLGTGKRQTVVYEAAKGLSPNSFIHLKTKILSMLTRKVIRKLTVSS